MKKVVYGISRYRNNDVAKLTGVGYITDEDLIIACLSKNQKPYLRVFEGCVRQAKAIDGRDNEFKCNFYEIKEIEYEVKNSSGESVGFDTKEIELEYNIWFKYAD